MSPPDDNRWHLKKEIQLGHLITTLTVAVSAVVYIQRIDTRVGLLEEKLTAQRAVADLRDKQNSEALTLLREQLSKMDGKLDRLIEKR